jgi:hypothetical protein
MPPRDLAACHAQRATGEPLAASIQCRRAPFCARYAAGVEAVASRDFYRVWMQPPPADAVCAEFVENQPVSTT